ncbi:MAG: DUF1292 domain-containing protein [Clostridia bacterium]|nr:DUF1292 domain-containing protein [Clostridia bacterium]
MNEEYTPDLVELTDEDGNAYNFEVIDAYEDGDDKYVALTPCNEDGSPLEDDDGTLIIMKAIEEEDETYFEEIEDDDEYNAVADNFINRLEDFYEIDEK